MLQPASFACDFGFTFVLERPASMRCCGAPRLMEMTRLWEGPQLASRAQSLRLVLRFAQLHFAQFHFA